VTLAARAIACRSLRRFRQWRTGSSSAGPGWLDQHTTHQHTTQYASVEMLTAEAAVEPFKYLGSAAIRTYFEHFWFPLTDTNSLEHSIPPSYAPSG
jgi:hypothetical protein